MTSLDRLRRNRDMARADPRTVQIRLPFPVSVNNMFPTVGRKRVPSAAYEAWKREVVRQLYIQQPRPITGPVNIRIDLVAPDRRRRDADNYNKPVLDALVRHSLIEADDNRTVRMVSTEWQDEGAPCLVTITAIEASRPMSLATTEGGSHHQPKEKVNG